MTTLTGRARARAGWALDFKTKKEVAIQFIDAIRTMEPGALNALIVRAAGEDLAQFFLSYSANLVSLDPDRVVENASSLMLMGYLIRTQEERRAPEGFQRPFQGYAFA